MKLSANLKILMKEKGWTLTKLAKEASVPTATLHGWINGRTVQNLDHARTIADKLEVPLYELLFGETDPHQQAGEEILEHLFSGDIRVTLHRIKKRNR